VVSASVVKKLLQLSEGYRTGELQRYAAWQDGLQEYDGTYAHHFWQSEYFVFSRPQYQTAVRLHSVRNANQEAAHNHEGLRNHFRGDGACHLSVDGQEYSGLQPVFDFRMIPGVTSPLLPYDPLEAWGSVNVLTSDIQFAGAVCSQFNIIAFQRIRHDNRIFHIHTKNAVGAFHNVFSDSICRFRRGGFSRYRRSAASGQGKQQCTG
jgi:hypothetical protein